MFIGAHPDRAAGRCAGKRRCLCGFRRAGSVAALAKVNDAGARPAILPLRHEAPVACPDWIYNNRNRVKRLWARVKEWRAVATRYEKTAANFLGVLCLAAALDWFRR
jgi:transposase